jgi:hypothetical protein
MSVFLLKETRGSSRSVATMQVLSALTAGAWLADEQRQLCWAHLRRDFQALVDRGGDSAIIGCLLLAQSEQMFALWHRVRDETLTRSAFQQEMKPIRREVENLCNWACWLSTTRLKPPGLKRRRPSSILLHLAAGSFGTYQ